MIGPSPEANTMETVETPPQSPETSSGAPRKRTFRMFTILAGTVIVGGVSIALLWTLVAFRPDNAFGIMVRSFFPIPMVFVDGNCITYGELDRDRESLRRFYESQAEEFSRRGMRIDFETPEGKNRLLIREKDILNKLLEDRLVVALAKDRGVSFSEREVSARVEEAIQKDSGSRETLERKLRASYGWGIAEFEERVVRPSLYREALEAIFEKERDDSHAQEISKKAVQSLRDGMSFEQVVRTFSDGSSKEKDGDMGWISVETLLPELQKASREQRVGDVGPLIESSLGYHILIVSERKGAHDDETVHLRQVFVRKPAFSEWLSLRKSEAPVWILSRRYSWDKEMGSVVFRDEALRAFEDRALERSEGDPSLIF